MHYSYRIQRRSVLEALHARHFAKQMRALDLLRRASISRNYSSAYLKDQIEREIAPMPALSSRYLLPVSKVVACKGCGRWWRVWSEMDHFGEITSCSSFQVWWVFEISPEKPMVFGHPRFQSCPEGGRPRKSNVSLRHLAEINKALP